MPTAKKVALVLAAVFAVMPITMAQFHTTAHDARSGAMGGCLFAPERVHVVVLDYRQGWLLSNLADKRISVAIPAGIGIVSAGYLHHGNSDYNEQNVYASYVINVAERLAVGIDARYLYAGSSDIHYQSLHYVGAGAIIMAHLGQRTTMLLAAQTRPWDAGRGFGMHLQVAYSPLQCLLTVLELESEEVWRVRAGMEYCYENHFFIRSGFVTNPYITTLGLGVKYGAITVDLSAEVHSVLGITPQTSLRICF